MKVFIRFFSAAVCILSFLSTGSLPAEIDFEPIISFKETSYLQVNKLSEIVFYENKDLGPCLCYSNIELNGNVLNLSEVISKQLLDLGYSPKSFSTKPNFKPWESEYTLNYDIRPYHKKYIDDFGNVLIFFSDESCRRENNKWLSRLGVWNNKFGFKVIEVPEIDDISYETFSTNEYLYAHGYNADGKGAKTLVIPIGNGYWGERNQDDSSNTSKTETWWDKIMKIFS